MPRSQLLGGLFSRIARNRLVVKAYESKLKDDIAKGPIPSHIAVILDGNRRWASSRGLSSVMGHEQGAKKAEELLNWCYDLRIRTVTLYVLSTENLGREQDEINRIEELFSREIHKAMEEKIFEKYGLRVKILGKRELWPDDVAKLADEIENLTEMYDRYFLNIALAYGGRDEITDAVRTICKLYSTGEIQMDDIDNNLMSKHLYTSHLPNPEPDLIIRTSGEMRLSNFLTWQSAYSELVFVDTFWPEFRRIDLWRAIRTYQRRTRRMGL